MFKRRKRDQRASASGHPILDHSAKSRRSLPLATASSSSRQAIESHLGAYLGPSSGLWQEILSENVRLDILIWAPTPQRQAYTLVTLGMSDLPMNLPPGAFEDGVARRAELMLCLPPVWPMPSAGGRPAAWSDPDVYFPIRWLKTLARLPHDYDSFLSVGHTIPNGEPAQALASNTLVSGWALIPPLTLPNEFHSVDLGQDKIDLLGLVALHSAELDFKLANGIEPLLASFAERGVSEYLDIGRPSLV